MKKIGNKIRRTYPNSVFADKVDTIVDRINGNRITPIQKLKKSMFINSDSNNKIISAINDAIDEKDVDLNVNSFRNPSVKTIASKLNEVSNNSQPMEIETFLMFGDDQIAINKLSSVSVESAEAIKVCMEDGPDAINFTYSIYLIQSETQEKELITSGIGDFHGPIGYAPFSVGTINFDEGNKYQIDMVVIGGNPANPKQLAAETYEIDGSYTVMVDLGLPSGLKWAKCNLGATKPEEYGKYFQWGDTVGYYAGEGAEEHSTWATAPFNNGSSVFDEAYFTAHKSEWLDNDVLKPEYDAATVNMGEGWRMPTYAESEELAKNTTNEFTTVNGVNGRRFTSKTNGNSIFIPYAGTSTQQYVGVYGLSWCRNFTISTPANAYNLYSAKYYCSMGSNPRSTGHCVRGVHE